jgi:hypothetical protein
MMTMTHLSGQTMKQMSLSANGFDKAPLRTRRQQVLEEMERVVPWNEWVALIAAHTPAGSGPKGARPPFALHTMAAHPLSPAVVRPVRSGHATSAARHPAVPQLLPA